MSRLIHEMKSAHFYFHYHFYFLFFSILFLSIIRTLYLVSSFTVSIAFSS